MCAIIFFEFCVVHSPAAGIDRIKNGKCRSGKDLRYIGDLYHINVSGKERDRPAHVIASSEAYAVFTYFTKVEVNNG